MRHRGRLSSRAIALDTRSGVLPGVALSPSSSRLTRCDGITAMPPIRSCRYLRLRAPHPSRGDSRPRLRHFPFVAAGAVGTPAAASGGRRPRAGVWAGRRRGGQLLFVRAEATVASTSSLRHLDVAGRGRDRRADERRADGGARAPLSDAHAVRHRALSARKARNSHFHCHTWRLCCVLGGKRETRGAVMKIFVAGATGVLMGNDRGFKQ